MEVETLTDGGSGGSVMCHRFHVLAKILRRFVALGPVVEKPPQRIIETADVDPRPRAES
ncbi:hypothetical protein PhaeoP75_01799 [Phaeobacter gallaeciensis]|uniref:Uncharacterized protein n=1 Tax=Phaeobacter gallaeciensis TaxID=60890 RepID=A0AAD0EBA6_9RHOB|nr:hypothetical protein Gal_01756 [Phaeobacter gallaeciensis DSM 26640]ATE92777.1 hypothetical protein PhaeoP11_01749 [Phaeobacter gallaeciensis]ATE97401.1 hypothetical protein PhaeoP73_02097 [Phaeobacter gallaeciensis]ATF01442.1 hypothetical protein PhaeoP75_01799 [Phaeobacter gallaeciensis]ATF05822.1 hypothetical protein PhaeoP63_01747 [Phaeobacter gallaeciensis]